MNILQTKRLFLRKFTPDDAPLHFALNSDPMVLQYTGDVAFLSEKDARSFLEQYDHYQLHGFGRWNCFRKKDGAFLGWCGLKFNEVQEIDLGYRFFRKEWNKGYATEAAKACLDYGFNSLKIKQIIGRVHPENLASIRVLEKVGMSYWKLDTCGDEDGFLYYRITRD
ncbi:MAG TPA: N-acetyltransferase [Saprospiraceae bacterium]|nr:N-acetyltransferase [Saprospiraceae bacterium]